MLIIENPDVEIYDENKEQFIRVKKATLRLEHSLCSISKWEEKFEKPFLVKEERTIEETAYYIKCMTLDNNVSDDVYKYITAENINKINDYISSKRSATIFSDTNNGQGGGNSSFLSSEYIYFLMSTYGIPYECDKWFFNRLINLIKICQIKNETPKKMSKNEIISRNSALNKARRAKFNSKG